MTERGSAYERRPGLDPQDRGDRPAPVGQPAPPLTDALRPDAVELFGPASGIPAAEWAAATGASVGVTGVSAFDTPSICFLIAGNSFHCVVNDFK